MLDRRPDSADTIDVADVVRTIRHQWRAVVAFIAVGVLSAAAVVLFAPRRFDGKATVLARPTSVAGASIASRITGIGELLGGLAGVGMPGSIETELQMLRSRVLAGQVVDSLQLQFIVRDPAGVPPLAFVSSSALTGLFKPRTFRFDRLANGTYRASHDGSTFDLTPGTSGKLDVGSITLATSNLPARFTLKVLDREDAIDRFGKRLMASKAGGDVAKLVYRGDDSLSAPAAVNALVGFYLKRRKTTDRGQNQRRVEYVEAQLATTGAQLASVERQLRQEQEASRVYDADVFGKVELEASAQLRKTLTDLQVEEGAINQLLKQADEGGITSRDLVAYPAFMRGSAVNALAQQLSDLEAQRIRLLERRTEQDPDVRALNETIKSVQANITAMARTYAAAVSQQRKQMQARVDSVQAALLALPAAAERGGRLQRDVRRLTTIYTALQAQLVEARLASIGEGGDVRQIDAAVPQRKPAFPRPWLTMGLGTAGGLLTGLLAALFLGWFGRWLRDPMEIERAVGIAAQRFDGDAPLLVSATPGARSVLVVPLAANAQTGTVAERLARTARQRALDASVLDLSTAAIAGNGKPAVDAARVGHLIDEAEQRSGSVIVQLPHLLSDITVAALREDRPVILVAPPGPVDRERLDSAVAVLRRLHVPCAGVVITDATGPRARALL